MSKIISKLSSRKRYLQIALNSTLEEAQKIIAQLPISDRILIEVGTPLIKRYGQNGIRQIKEWYIQRIHHTWIPALKLARETHLLFKPVAPLDISASNTNQISLQDTLKTIEKDSQSEFNQNSLSDSKIIPYVVADLKMMDRGETEVEIAAEGEADAAVALGHAPIESLNAFIQECEKLELDAMIDMMNVEYPLSILRQLKKLPRVVILHRGVDEERFNKEKQLPLYEIRRIKGNYDVLIAVAGGDTLREVQRAIFNDADIVVVWKSFFQSSKNIAKLAGQFLKEIK